MADSLLSDSVVLGFPQAKLAWVDVDSKAVVLVDGFEFRVAG
jgi:hypothetical protein